MPLANKTVFVTGASRGIGLAIALACAKRRANIVIAAKTETAHPKLPGTIYSAAEEIEKAGGKALPLVVDVREEESVATAMKKAAEAFGGVDIVVNNASAINLSPIRTLDMKRFDLMHQVNARGTYLTSKCALPYLTESAKAGRNPHILMLSPPLDMKVKWFAGHTGYSMAKFGMSLVVLGLSGELAGKVAVNALWPRTPIATAAVNNLLGGEELMRMSRTPEILSDAAIRIFEKPASFTGNFLIDDTFLAEEGVTAFDHYRVDPTKPLAEDFFVPADVPAPKTASYGPLT